MPTIITRGAASAQALGFGSSSAAVNYIEDVFSTYLYTGTGANLTINNGVDLSGKGGLTWIKQRSGSQDHTLFDTLRGVNNYLRTNSTGAQNPGGTYTDLLTAFNSNGFTLGADASSPGFVNASGSTYASWTFREQPKFFDIVTYTGDGTNRTIAHNLGSVPGMIVVKSTTLSSASSSWAVYHRSMAATDYLSLNSSSIAATGNTTYWNSTAPTASVFSVGTNLTTNGNGQTYVAYLFAHDAGGFGLTGTDNVISCGSGTSNASGIIDPVTLGFEPQFVIAKATGTTSQWFMLDTMRGDSLTSISYLQANTSGAETTTTTTYLYPTATGFAGVGNFFGANQPYIYIAIRRGPMKVPTVGTSVFTPLARTGTGATATVTGLGFTPDLVLTRNTTSAVSGYTPVVDRLRGAGVTLYTGLTNNEATDLNGIASFAVMNGISFGNDSTNGAWNFSTYPYINWFFQRAPGFFDVVCYTGTGVDRTVAHNLGAVPELMIVKARANARNWTVYSAATGNTGFLILNNTAAYEANASTWGTTLTSSVFSVGGNYTVNDLDAGMVAYLFATCPGVSKVGSYTGNGTTQTINCGLTAGARFVLIKRTDAVGGWYVYDTARGMTVLTDPYLLLNSTAAEVATLGSVTTVSTGFALNSAILAAINVNAGNYIFLAIA